MYTHPSTTQTEGSVAALLRVSDRGTAAIMAEKAETRATVRRIREALWPLRVAASALECMTLPEFIAELETRVEL